MYRFQQFSLVRRAGRQAGRQADRWAGGQAGGQAGRQAGRWAGGQAGGQAGRQAGGWAGGRAEWADRQTDRQTLHVSTNYSKCSSVFVTWFQLEHIKWLQE